MPLKNYTTTIASAKTIGEIQQTLARAGCRKIVTDFDEKGEPTALTFAVSLREQLVFFALPCQFQGVLKVFQRDPKVPRKNCTLDQARRTAWRNIKDWVESQLALIEAGQAELAEVFLPYAVTPSGQTLYREMEASGLKLLGTGS